MSNYRFVRTAADGNNEVSDGTRTATVAAVTLSGTWYTRDMTVETTAGEASSIAGGTWTIDQAVLYSEDDVPASITVEYTASQLGLLTATATHDGTISQQVTLNGNVTATYDGGSGEAPAHDTSGTFTDSRGKSWTTAELAPAGKEAKRDHDWGLLSFPIMADHSGGTQCKQSSTARLQELPQSYFGRSAKKEGEDWYIISGKGARFRNGPHTWGDLDLRDCDTGGNDQQSDDPDEFDVDFQHDVYDSTTDTKDGNDAAVGVKQRLRLMVPNVYTQLTLGEAVNNSDSDGYNYPGFGVQTKGHVFISAGTENASGADDAPKHYMLLQGRDGASLASPDGAVFLAGGGGVNISGVGGATMVSEQGVMIAGGNVWGALAGIGSEFVDRQTATDTPSVPSWASTQGQIAAAIGGICAATDVYVGLFGAKMQHKRKTSLGLTSDAYSGWGGASGFGKAGIVASTLGVLGGLIGATGTSWPVLGSMAPAAIAGTTIFGQSGMILQSALTMGLYSLGGTAIGTKDSLALVASKGTTIDAGKELAMSGEDVALMAGKGVEVIAASGATIAARNGIASVLGTTVALGTPVDDKKQKKTATLSGTADNVTFFGAKSAQFRALETVAMGARTVGITAGTLTLGADGQGSLNAQELSIGAEKKLRIAVGNAAIVMEPSKLGVGWYPKGYHPGSGLVDLFRQQSQMKKEISALGREIVSQRARAIMLGQKPPACSEQEKAITGLEEKIKGLDDVAKELKSAECKNALWIKSSGIEVIHEGYRFQIKPGKASFANNLVIQK